MDQVLRRLDDENEIKKMVIRFSLGMDSRDVAMFRSAWAEEVDLDLPPLGGDMVRLSGHQRADEYAEGVIGLLSQFRATQHVSTNHLVSIFGDNATCTCYTVAQHYMQTDSGELWFTAGARYELAAERDDQLGWRFVRFKLVGLWARGNQSVWAEAASRLASDRAG